MAINKEKQYIKNSIYFNLQKKEISELLSKPLSKDKYKLKIINKDIINEYLDQKLNEKIMQLINNKNEFKEEDINNIVNIIMKNKKDKEYTVKELTLYFLLPEEFKVYNLEFPTNFYIITEERFNKIFENSKNLTDFKTYDAYLGKEGIFMWIEGDMITSEDEGKTKDYKKVMYYIENNDYEDLKINKIFLFKNEEELKEQLDIIFEKGKGQYFEERNVIKTDLGSYNMINDGKIIGKYINVKKNVKESKSQIENSVCEVNADEIKKDVILRIEEKEGLSNLFLPYLLICLSKIKKMKKGIDPNKKGLLKSLLKIINSIDNNENSKNIGNNISEFIDEFEKKDLINNFSYSNEEKCEGFKNLIEMLLEEFHQEIYIEDKPRTLYKDYKNSTFIFDLFYGLKKINDKEKFFKTIELNTKDSGNQQITIENLITHYKFKPEELVVFFPNVLILLIIDDLGLLKLPLELNLECDKKDINKYNLRSCIQISSQGLFSFIINDETQNFSKIQFFEENNKIVPNKEYSNIEEINMKLSGSYNICFYEIDVEDVIKNENNSEVANEDNNNSNCNSNNQDIKSNNP